MTAKQIREEMAGLKKEALSKVGTSGGETAKQKYDLLKSEIELERNRHLYWISIFLAVIALTNIIVQIIKLLMEARAGQTS
ncbi:MAG: hypothetical protein DMF63_05320 [Acidobacteria bacterium]|nr:MAG: hypothetical protein DMF63_05320 [Acidobacteriota bacterium]